MPLHFQCGVSLLCPFVVSDGKLATGMTTQNAVEIDGVKNVLIIPSSAVKNRGGKAFIARVGCGQQGGGTRNPGKL